MDRRKFALQIRAILVTYRIERLAHNAGTLDAFRDRAHLLLDELALVAAPHPDLLVQVAMTRAEIDANER